MERQTNRNLEMEPKNQKERGSLLSAAALIIGVIFVVLAGTIFAATTWWTMSNGVRVLTILGVAAVFFAVSVAAERILSIGRTAAACYLLGSVFLFLAVAAAGCFGFLGPLSSGENWWWRTFSAGSLTMTAALFLGLRRFGSYCYMEICLWSIPVNVVLMMKAAGFSDSGMVQGMAVYGSLLTVLTVYGVQREDWIGAGFRFCDSFARIQFILTAAGLMTQCWGGYLVQLFDIPTDFFGTTAGNLISMMAVTGAWALLTWKRGKSFEKFVFPVLVTELIHITVMGMTAMPGAGMVMSGAGTVMSGTGIAMPGISIRVDQKFCAITVLMTLFFVAGNRWFSRLCSKAGQVAVTAALFGDVVMTEVLVLLGRNTWDIQVEAILCVLLLAWVMIVWGRQYKAVRMMVPLILWYLIIPMHHLLKSQGIYLSYGSFEKWVTVGYVGALMVWNVVREDVFTPGIGVISSIMFLSAVGNREPEMQTMWLFMIGLYLLRFAGSIEYGRQAATVSMVLLTAAFLRQPWIVWPEIVRRELFLLPVAGNLYGLDWIWGPGKKLSMIQTIGYVTCLVILGLDAVAYGRLADALILEGICLVVFLMAHLVGSVRWVRISGGFLLAVAFFMTRDFWLSIAWWVYLLAAGIGLILFAAVREKKKSREEQLL